jgi:hypothetical protein
MPGDEEIVQEAEKPKRAPRKRVPKPVSDDGDRAPAPVRRAPRRVASKPKSISKEAEPLPQRTATRSTARKAPTPIAAKRAVHKSTKRQTFVVVLLMILGVGSSAAVGFFDKGRIDINSIIQERNRKIESGEVQGTVVPIQNTNTEPYGGLIPVNGATETAPPVATSTASTSDATASSTSATSSSTASESNDALVPVNEESTETDVVTGDTSTQ